MRWIVDLTLMVGAIMVGWWLMGLALRRYGLLAPEQLPENKPADAEE